jgi:hypothetical protein
MRTSQHLARAIGCILADFTPPGEVIIPAKVVERSKSHVAGEAYPASLGEEEAKGVVAHIKYAEWAHSVGEPFPEFLAESWKIGRDLKPRRRK